MRQKHRQSGYTLIDLVLSLAIIGILSGIIVANLHRGKVYGDLVVAAQRLSNSVRQMQTFALNSRVDQCVVSDELCAWGVYLISGENQYRLFEDWFQHIGAYHDQELYQAPVLFPAGITIQGIRAREDAEPWTNRSRVSITFSPPDPEIMICGNNHNDCDYNEVEITLGNGADNRILNINIHGLIDIIQ